MHRTIPRITVVMPAYNAEHYLAEAINSMLAQSFADFELLIVDDGSQDATFDIAICYDDPRIRVLRNEKNAGLVFSLNRGIHEAESEFIARMDADDISLPDRLQKELELIESDSRLGIVSCGYEDFVGEQTTASVLLPLTDEAIRYDLFCKTHCFCHAAALMRREALVDIGGYRKEWFPAEDRDLFLRLMMNWHGANLPEVLYRVRKHNASVVATNTRRQANLVVQSTVTALAHKAKPDRVEEQAAVAGWSRGHLFAAMGLAASTEKGNEIEEHFQQAVHLDPQTAHNSFVELLQDRLNSYMHNYEADIAGAIHLVERVFSSLPAEWNDLQTAKRQFVSQVYAIGAFYHAQTGENRLARQAARASLRHSRQQWHNRGLIKLAIGMR